MKRTVGSIQFRISITGASLNMTSERGSVSRNNSAWETICDGSPCRTTWTPCAAQNRVCSPRGSRPQMEREPEGDADVDVAGTALTMVSNDCTKCHPERSREGSACEVKAGSFDELSSG